MRKQPCSEKAGLKRGPWTMDEDSKLVDFILNNGIQCWRLVPKRAGLMRCGKSCRLRWLNYLRPDLKRGGFTEAEEEIIIQLQSRLGNRWSKIAAHFPGRTDNEIKNHWNTRIRKRLLIPHNSAAEANQGFQENVVGCEGVASGIQESFCMDSWQNLMDEAFVWDGLSSAGCSFP